jgi:hypothetical protein
MAGRSGDNEGVNDLSPPVPADMTDAITAVTHWLDAYERGDWGTLWDGHAPDALMPIGPQVLQQRLIPRATYVSVLESMVAAQVDQPVPAFTVSDLQALPGADGPTVLARLQERRDGITCIAAFQLDADRRITAITVDPPTAANLTLLAAADLAQLPRPMTRSEAFRTALDHAYARRHRGMTRPLRSLPEARFTCQGIGDCCKVGIWNIAVSDNQLLPLSVVAAEGGGTPFTLHTAAAPATFADPEAATERHRLATGEWPDCHQVTADGRCGIHAAVGWQPVPVCQLYPISPVPTPDGFDLTAAFSCLTVCRNQGAPLQEQAAALRQRIWPFQFRLAEVPADLALVQGGDPVVPWAMYREWEGNLLDVLAKADADGLPDLRVGNRFMAKQVAGAAPAQGLTVDELFSRMVQPDTPEREEAWLGGSSNDAWRRVQDSRVVMVDREDLFIRYLRAQLFRKHGLVGGETGVGFPWGLTVIIAAMIKTDARYRALKGGRPRTSAQDLVNAVRCVEQVVQHDAFPVWLAGLPGAPVESPATWQAFAQV